MTEAPAQVCMKYKDAAREDKTKLASVFGMKKKMAVIVSHGPCRPALPRAFLLHIRKKKKKVPSVDYLQTECMQKKSNA